MGLYPATAAATAAAATAVGLSKFAPLDEPALLMKFDNQTMTETIVNVKGEGVAFCDLRRKSATVAPGTDLVLMAALVAEYDYYTRADCATGSW